MGVNLVNAQPAKTQRVDPQRSAQSVSSNGAGLSFPSPMQKLQRAVGNRAMTSLLRSRIIQPKLTVSHPDDEYEREADHVAEQVMRMHEPQLNNPRHNSPTIHRFCRDCEDELQRQTELRSFRQRDPRRAIAQLGSDKTEDDFESYLANSRGSGQPLSPSTRDFFEPRFGHDFSHVRVHSDNRATEASHEIGAQAFTIGSHVYFNSGRYDPSSAAGRTLLSHELTHVVQQGHANPTDRSSGVDSVLTTTQSAQHFTGQSNLMAPSAIINGIEPAKIEISPSTSVGVIQRQPGARAAVRRALIWLGRRGATVSRHVARHTRRIAGRALHSIFRKPNQVKKLIQRTLSAPDRVLAQSGRRVRYIVEKEFGRVIGKNGETIIHVVIEASGRIVTAYPVRSFTAASVAFLLIDEASAEARAQLDDLESRAARAMEAAEPSFLEDVVLDFVTFGLYGGELNAGEDIELRVMRESNEIVRRTCENVIRDVEEAEQASLGPEARDYICQLVEVALTEPDMLDELESQVQGGEE